MGRQGDNDNNHLKSSSQSSGRGACSASFHSLVSCAIWPASISTSWGLRASPSTRQRLESPTRVRRIQRKGFSYWQLDLAEMSKYCRLRLRWKVIWRALTLRSFWSTLFPTSTMGMLSQIRVRSLYHLGTFLQVIRVVTSNIRMAALAPMQYPSLRPPSFSCPAVSHRESLMGPWLVQKVMALTQTPWVAMYFFSNSPVMCLLTKVVLPTPPSPTRTTLNQATGLAACIN